MISTDWRAYFVAREFATAVKPRARTVEPPPGRVSRALGPSRGLFNNHHQADPDPRSAAGGTPRSREPDGQRSPTEVVSRYGAGLQDRAGADPRYLAASVSRGRMWEVVSTGPFVRAISLRSAARDSLSAGDNLGDRIGPDVQETQQSRGSSAGRATHS
jgi:hypothetical protein